eukprot:SAG31_NODE_21176_length_556_cov_0.765864_2_plen_85_part_01
MLSQNVDVRTTLTIRAGQHVLITGDKKLVHPPMWGSSGFTVQQFGSLSLARISLEEHPSIILQSGSSLSLASMNVTQDMLTRASN